MKFHDLDAYSFFIIVPDRPTSTPATVFYKDTKYGGVFRVIDGRPSDHFYDRNNDVTGETEVQPLSSGAFPR